MKQPVSAARVRPSVSLSYAPDVTYEMRMMSQVKAVPQPARCIHCDKSFVPRFIGDQACGDCREQSVRQLYRQEFSRGGRE